MMEALLTPPPRHLKHRCLMQIVKLIHCTGRKIAEEKNRRGGENKEERPGHTRGGEKKKSHEKDVGVDDE